MVSTVYIKMSTSWSSKIVTNRSVKEIRNRPFY